MNDSSAVPVADASRARRVIAGLPHAALGRGTEFDVIRRMLERWGSRASAIGDDAAILTLHDAPTVVVSVDTSVENVHFRREWLTPEEIGYRAAAAALSDLAAMAATPVGMLVALTVPQSWRGEGVLDSIADGVGEASTLYEVPILGGDLSAGAELSLSCTVLGTGGSRLLRRTAATAGDAVYVTGQLGGSRAALASFQRGEMPSPGARERFVHPVPRIREAMWLAERGATAAVDISDGLVADLGHIAAASGVGIKLELDSICSFEGVPLLDAAASGEEYELAVTSPVELDASEFRALFDLELTKVGYVTEGNGTVTVRHAGQVVDTPGGYLHFAPVP